MNPKNEEALIRELRALRKLLAVLIKLRTEGKSNLEWAVDEVNEIEKEADK